MAKQIISMREFLRTGALGPITCTLTLLDVAKVLGAPDRFVTACSENIPTYWCYGKLEIEFDDDAPYRMNWFQLEFAGELEGDFETLTDSLILSLEGISGQSRPSTFLKANLWEPVKTIAHIGALADDIMLNLCAGPVQIFFRIDSTFISDGDAERYIIETPLDAIIRDIDARTEIDSIYSLPTAEAAGIEAGRTHKFAIDGATYLAALSRVEEERS